ncbi:MAG TPA: flavodoxin family protein [Acidimicrobiales bacterium]|nr:flavodoxin family protein [Acidimicrobiales bacterium]
MKRAIVIYESLTGNTRRAAERIARELDASGVSTAACPIMHIDYPALAAADMVIVGTWTDGIFVVGQRPGRAGRLWLNLPAIDRKRTAVYCTYAINPGKTLAKLGNIVAGRGGDVIGGYAIRRNRIEAGAETFVDRLLDAVPADA